MTQQEKYGRMPLSSFSIVRPFFFLLLRPTTAKKAWKFIWIIIKDFFCLQWSNKLGIRKIPVIKVDTSLDNLIPFSPNHISDYLSFIDFFIKPFDMLEKCLGYKKAAPYMNLYLKYLTNIYSNAAKIYKFCMTTTLRPKYLKTRKFRTIHLFDPHLLCVPSIHVAIASGTYFWFSQTFQTDILPEHEAEFRLTEIKQWAYKIVESVLFVKQHSVNCVPMALYMISSTMSKSFSSPTAISDFIDDLFMNSTEITDENKAAINEHFHFIYERSYLENKYSDDWETAIKHWLISHAKETNQNLPYGFPNDVL